MRYAVDKFGEGAVAGSRQLISLEVSFLSLTDGRSSPTKGGLQLNLCGEYHDSDG